MRAAGAEALFIQCDLCDPAAQAAAFRRHWHDFGALDVTFLNAGVEELRPFLESPDDPAGDAALLAPAQPQQKTLVAEGRQRRRPDRNRQGP